MKAKLHYVFSISIFLVAFSLNGQNSSWKTIKPVSNSKTISGLNLNPSKVQYFKMQSDAFYQKLKNSQGHLKKINSELIKIPSKNGVLQSFIIEESTVFSPSLAAKFPNIKSYKGYATDNSGAQLTMSVSPQGIQTMITYPDAASVFMHPIQKGGESYVVYQREHHLKQDNHFECGSLESLKRNATKTNSNKLLDEGGANNQILQKFRIAVSVTGEYTAFHGGTVSGALSAINATMARVNAIFEADMAITFELVDATELIYTDANTDPYSDPNIGTNSSNFGNLNGWSLQLQNNLSATIGNAAYDIGHLLGHDGGGGFAGCLGCVCDDDNTSNDFDFNKGSGYTSPPDGRPEGDAFDLDFVIHEIGHQMGGNHTWSFESEGTGVQMEPGSGTTVMGYAGITAENDVESNSDPYFHFASIKQILDNLTSKSCQTNEVISNNPPSADAGSDFIIPASTPYVLKGTASDTDTADMLTYCWEQIDNGIVNNNNFGPNVNNGAMNRSLPPSTSPDRYIPRLSSVLRGRITQTQPGLGSDWETASDVSRVLNWALTVRDRDPQSNTVGQSSYDTMSVEVRSGTAGSPIGPFMVTSQNEADISWIQNSTETITWDVAGTNGNGINTSNVNILLSTDGGLTFDTVLATNTPNDGSENIIVPDVAATNCRIMIQPVDNIYYAVNSTDFAIGFEVTTTCEQQFLSGENLNLSILDGQTTTHTINVPSNGTISSIKTNVDVTHTFISDLTVTLQHPNGNTSSVVWAENCFRNTGHRDFDITFDDDASSVNCDSPTTGTFIPSNPLSIFEGLNMQGNWTLSITDGFSGDEGVINDWFVEFCTVSFQRLEDTFVGFTVFPNPNDGVFNLKLNTDRDERNLNIEVFDTRGRLVYEETFSGASRINKEVNLDHFKAGLYFINLNDSIETYTYKVLIN